MKKCIYTIAFGDYDLLKEPTNPNSEWDYICFSDIDRQSEHWKIIKVDLPYELRLQARACYIQSSLFVKDYDLSVMIGTQIRIDGCMNEFINKYVDLSKDINLMQHPCRTCLYKEAEIIVREKIDKMECVSIQMHRYHKEGMPRNFGLSACGIIIRKKTVRVANFERMWWGEVVKNIIGESSYRDQLSFDYVRWKLNGDAWINWFPYNVIFGDYFSVYFRKTENRIGGL